MKIISIISILFSFACGVPQQSEQSNSLSQASTEQQQHEYTFAIEKTKLKKEMPNDRSVKVVLVNSKTGDEQVVNDYHILESDKNGVQTAVVYGTVSVAAKDSQNYQLSIRDSEEAASQIYLTAPVTLSNY